MKSSFFTFIILCIVLFSFSACKEDEGEARFLAYATVTDGPNKVLISDGEVQRLFVVENASEMSNWTTGKRVIVDYTIIREHESASMLKSYYVRLNSVYDVLTKTVVKKSFLNTTAREDSIGHDPINIRNYWFANDYLNIDFMLYRNNPGVKHFVNLVVDDSKSTADDVYLELRHNAYFDLQTISTWGNVSFKVADLVVPPKTSVKLHLSRFTYDGAVKTDTLNYTLGVTYLAPVARSSRLFIQ